MGRAEFIAINKRYTNKQALPYVIRYAVAKKDKNKNKIGKARFIGGIGVDYMDTEKAIKQIQTIKKYYGKTDKRQLYHFLLTFAEDIDDAQQVYLIGNIIVNKFFSDYQVIFAVHEDSKSDHLHIHFVINSVCFRTGLKWHMSAKEFNKFKKAIEKETEFLLGEV